MGSWQRLSVVMMMMMMCMPGMEPSMASAQQCTSTVVLPKETRVPIVRSSCHRSDTVQGSCLDAGVFFQDVDFLHRGSELNNGRQHVTQSDADCCKLCRETPGCKVWVRFQDNEPYNDKGTCWMKSSVPAARKRVGLNAGIVVPQLPEDIPCNELPGVGIRDRIPYNDPTLLQTEDWSTCCLWCQEADEFCTGWMWSASSGFCHLYGTAIEEENKYLCRDCVSGTRRANRELVLQFEKCKHGGALSDIKYIGSSRTVLATAGAFMTRSSKECCGLCEGIKSCRSWTWKSTNECILNTDVPPRRETGGSDILHFGGVASPKACFQEECEIVEDVFMEGGDLFCSQFAAPAPAFLAVDTAAECCLRCQEFPECKSWTFSIGKPGQNPTACFLKSGIPLQHEFLNVKDLGLGLAWSGIVHSHIENHEVQEFRNRVANIPTRDAVPVQTEQRGGKGKVSVLHIAIAIAGAVVMCMLCIILISILLIGRRNRRLKTFNDKRMQMYGFSVSSPPALTPTSRESVTPVPVTHTREPLSISKVPSSIPDPSPVGMLFFQQSIGRVSQSQASSTYMNSNNQDAGRFVSEKRFEYLKQRLGDMKGPDGRFRSAIEDLEDEDWAHSNHKFSSLPLGTVLGGKYAIEGGNHMGDNSIVMDAKQRFNYSTPVVLKFFRQERSYEVELSLFQQHLDFPCIPQVLDAYEASVVESWGLPPLACIVMERGSATLSQWLQRHHHTLDHMDQRSMLFKICKAVCYIHERGIVHRDIKPENIVIFNDTLTWKLIDFGSWARKGCVAAFEYTLRYAPPEVLTAHATDDDILAMPSMDMWALGLLFWEVLTGEALLGQEYTSEQVMSMLMGVEELPFETHPEMWQRIEHPAARRIVENLLRRNPTKRWTIQKVLQNGYFLSAPDTVQLHEGHKEYANVLRDIAGAVERVENKVQQVENIAIENLKHAVGSILIACFSFYEVDPEEVIKNTQMDSEIAEMYSNNSLKMTKTLTEPSYNLFRRAKEEPAVLLRLDKQHLLKITLMCGGDVALNLPISEIVFARITPTGIGSDCQEMQIFPVFKKGHLMEGVGLWKTTDHREACLQLIGNTSIEISIGLRMESTGEVIEVKKTVDIRMHAPDETFMIVKQFYRTKEWYSNLPPWAKIYIHGAVAVVSLASKGLL